MGTDPGPQPFHFRYQSFAIEVGEVFVHSVFRSKVRARVSERLPDGLRAEHEAHQAHKEHEDIQFFFVIMVIFVGFVSGRLARRAAAGGRGISARRP